MTPSYLAGEHRSSLEGQGVNLNFVVVVTYIRVYTTVHCREGRRGREY